MKRRLWCIFACVLVLGMTGCKKKEAEPVQTEEDTVYTARMTVRDYGEIVFEMKTSTAPETVKNFVELAESGFYDGLTFHRIMDGFMIQGGDPDGNGNGGSGKTIHGEFSSNGYKNPLSHVCGTVSMARAKNPDSASSQFFICVADNTYLDGDYAAFVTVIEGLEVAMKIAADSRPIDNNGTILPEEQPVIESIVIEK